MFKVLLFSECTLNHTFVTIVAYPSRTSGKNSI